MQGSAADAGSSDQQHARSAVEGARAGATHPRRIPARSVRTVHGNFLRCASLGSPGRCSHCCAWRCLLTTALPALQLPLQICQHVRCMPELICTIEPRLSVQIWSLHPCSHGSQVRCRQQTSQSGQLSCGARMTGSMPSLSWHFSRAAASDHVLRSAGMLCPICVQCFAVPCCSSSGQPVITSSFSHGLQVCSVGCT